MNINISNILQYSVAAFLLSSCSVENDEILSAQPKLDAIQETIDISLGGNEQETRALDGNYLYAINVWLDRNKDGIYGSSDFYAKGVFSSLTGIKLTTYPGYALKFQCTIVKDAQDVISTSLSDGVLTYGLPFSSACTNQFEYSNATTTLTAGKQLTGGVKLATGVSNADGFYYGELLGFTPTVDGEKAVIPVKRMNYGYRIIVEGVTNGTATLNFDGQSYDFSKNSYTTPDKINIISGSDVQEAFKKSDLWTKTLVAKLNYVSNRKSLTEENYWNKTLSNEVTLKRTKFTIVRIKLSGLDNSSAGFEIELEELDFEDETKDILMQVDKNDVGTVSK